MAIITVPLNSGIDNFSDGEEVGVKGNLRLENVYISTPGKIIQRPYSDNLTTLTNTKIHKIKRWANPDLPFQGFGWVAVVTDLTYNSDNNLDSHTKRLVVYSRDFSQVHPIGVIESGVVPRKIEILENVALFTMGTTEDSLRYRFYDSQFFDGQHTIQGWRLDIGRPINNFVTLQGVLSGGDSGSGLLEDNKYFFYKVVPVFDGLQISQLPNHYKYAVSTVDEDKMVLELEVDLNNMNPRCSSIDIYRAEGTNELEEDLNYYKIKSISMYAPMSQTGAIIDNATLGGQIADNQPFYDSSLGADYSPDDWMCMLTPMSASETASDNLTTTTTQKCSMIRMFNVDSTAVDYDDALKTSDIAPYQSNTNDNEGLSTEDTHDFDNPTYELQASDGNDVYPLKAFAHTQTSANDNATDIAYIPKIRQTDHNSEGGLPWYAIKRQNIIENGSFMGSSNYSDWNISVPYAQSQNVPNNYWGDSCWWSSSNYKGQGGYTKNITTRRRPQMTICSHFGSSSAGQGNAYSNDSGSVCNNQFLQTVTLEAGKKYWVQYAYQWGIRNNFGDHQKKQYGYVKLTKPNGAQGNGSNFNYQSKNSTDGIFYHEYGYYSGNSRHYVSGNNLADYERGWWKYGKMFTAPDDGDYTFNFWFHAREDYAYAGFQYQTHLIRIKDVGIFEVDERSNYYAGNQVLMPNEFKNYDDDTGNPLINTNDYQGGNAFVDDVKYPLSNNVNTIFELDSAIPSNMLGVQNILLTQGLSATESVGTDGNPKMTIEFNDIGYSSVMKHPTHEIPLNTKYEFSQYIEGRMFVANCRYTNEQYDDVEQDANLVLFSNLNQPNIIPITNYIKVQDNQGGNITGLAELMGNLVVFLEDSIWRINVPSTDPNNWSLVESSKELGCTSKSSIMSYEDGVFFANKEGLWGLSQNFMPKELSKLWRNHYQENYHDETIVHYCPKSHMLYVNQNNPYETWVLDINSDTQTTSWLKLVQKSGASEMSGWSGFMNDETTKPFFFENRGDDCVIGELEPRVGNNKLGFAKRTGWIRLGNLEDTHMIRRVNFRYKNKYQGLGFVPDLKIYINGSDTVAYEKGGDELFLNQTGEETIASLRCGVRCRYFSFELAQESVSDVIGNVEDLFEVLTIDIEWE